ATTNRCWRAAEPTPTCSASRRSRASWRRSDERRRAAREGLRRAAHQAAVGVRAPVSGGRVADATAVGDPAGAQPGTALSPEDWDRPLRRAAQPGGTLPRRALVRGRDRGRVPRLLRPAVPHDGRGAAQPRGPARRRVRAPATLPDAL